MRTSNLSTRVADRYSELRKAILVSRWLLSNRKLALGLQEALKPLREGKSQPAIQALDNLWMAFEIHTGDDGSFRPHAEWYYPLSLESKVRVRELILGVKDLRGSLTKSGSLPRFEGITKEAEWLEGVLPKSEGFQHGNFTVIPMRGVTPKEVSAYLTVLDNADRLVRPEFPEVLYGKVYVGKVALYVHDLDTVCVKVGGDVHAICHELGHRFFHKFWTNPRERETFRHFPAVSKYAKIKDSWLENFAESFALRVTKKPLSAEISAALARRG